MRSIWKGAISFGLVSIPIKVYAATEERTLSFHQLHDEDHARIRYARICSKEEKEVPWEEIVSGYEYSKGRYVVLSDEELEAVPVPSAKTIDVSTFVDLSEVDPIYYRKTYYLVPAEGGAKAYRLLHKTLEETGRAGIGKVALREKEHLAAIRPQGKVLVLETMFWPDEIREPSFDELDSRARVDRKELEMARSLVSSLSEAFDPKSYTDEYREALKAVIERKKKGQGLEEIPEPEEAPRVVDLMDALKASLEATEKRPRRGGKRRAS